MDSGISRRVFVKVGGLGLVAGACAPSAAPQSPASASAGGQPAPAAKAAWEVEWDKLVAAAKVEGKLVVQTATGSGYREALEEFNKAFPGVEATQLAFADAATYVPKIKAERQAGVYSFDAALIPPTSALQQLKPDGVFDPLRPLLFRPDILDDKVWDGGFELQWCDVDKKLAFFIQRDVNHNIYINTDLVKPAELAKVEDLVDPKWKGKMVMADPRQGAVRLPMTSLWLSGKKDLIKKMIIDQEPQIIRDRRQNVEALVRGRVPFAVGILKAVLHEFKKDGLAQNVIALDLPEIDYQPHDIALVFNRAPHPNAAKLFLNWILTEEGQTAWSKNVFVNANRIDVPIINPTDAPKPGVVYKNRNQEAIYPIVGEVEKHIADILKAANL
ncbi:MAG: extracellular solute-binding protein [Dehalococcoidia bacterium]|nr:extracellular solute-binding protein [Dehalococcoidia bacterium]